MKTKTIASLLTVTSIIALSTGCSSTSVNRIQAGGTESLVSQNVDLADFKAAAAEVSQIIIVHPAFAKFEAKNGRMPIQLGVPLINQIALILVKSDASMKIL